MPAIYDISLPLSDQLPVWPGDPPVTLARVGDPAGPWVSRLGLGSHAGTHVDAPAHFIPGGATVDRLPLEVLIGPAWVVHLPGPGPLAAADLAAAGIPAGVARLLLRTRNSDSRSEFAPDIVALAPDASDWLLARGVRLMGIDAPSFEPCESPGEPVHRALLSAGVVILEGLALAGIVPGAYQLVCLPLRLAGGDGAPARAILIGEDRCREIFQGSARGSYPVGRRPG
jgi:arylformamidase